MRLALITGASRGLGLSLYEQLQAQGWDCIDISRAAPHPSSRRVDLAALQPANLGPLLAGLPREGVQELLIVHNAAVAGPIAELATGLAPELVQLNTQANFSGALLLLTALVAHYQALPAARKWLFNISSGAALRPIAGWSLYCAAKAGTEHFVRVLAEEQRSQAHPFLALNLNPGVMDTGMQADLRASQFPDRERFLALHAEGRLQDPARVAARTLALLTRADLENGARLDVSGA